MTDITEVCEGIYLGELRREFRLIVEALNCNNIGFYLLGNIASSEYREPRATTDIEIQLTETSIISVSVILKSLGFELICEHDDFFIKSSQKSKWTYTIYIKKPVHTAFISAEGNKRITVLDISDIPIPCIYTLVWHTLINLAKVNKKYYFHESELMLLLESPFLDLERIKQILYERQEYS